MSARKPLVIVSGQVEQLQSGDTLDASANEVDVVSLVNGEAGAIDAGMVVYLSAASTCKKSKADAAGTMEGIGLARALISNGVPGDIQTNGQLTIADWTAVIGAAALTAGAHYYVSEATAGKMAAAAPATGYVQRIGIALSTTMMQINIQPAIKL
jgi:hypothetical protein